MKNHIAIFLASSVWMVSGCTKEEVPRYQIVQFAVQCNTCTATWVTSDASRSQHFEGLAWYNTTGITGSTATLRCTEDGPDMYGMDLWVFVNGIEMGQLSSDDIGLPQTAELSITVP